MTTKLSPVKGQRTTSHATMQVDDVAELPVEVVIGAAVRFVRRRDQDKRMRDAIIASLCRHAEDGDATAAMVADWVLSTTQIH